VEISPDDASRREVRVLPVKADAEVIISDSIILDATAPTITTTIASSNFINNNWYNLLSIKGEAQDSTSSVQNISSCITTNTSCTPNSSTSSSTKTVSISTSNTTAQRVCFRATDSVGNQSEITCSEAYKVDVDSAKIINLEDRMYIESILDIELRPIIFSGALKEKLVFRAKESVKVEKMKGWSDE